jgi:hypothetical protein
MDFDELTPDQQETVKHMVRYCLNQCVCLGMDEGYTYADEDWQFKNPIATPLRVALTNWSAAE